MKKVSHRRSAQRAPYNVDQQTLIPLPGTTQPGPAGTAGDDQANTPAHSPITDWDSTGTRGRSWSGQKSPDLSLSPPLYRGDRVGDSPRPRHHTPRTPITKQDQKRDCDPHCLTCHRPDGQGHCTPHCAPLCWHAHRHHRADICITITKADAWIVISPNTGYMHLHVRNCPHCGHHHAHAAHDHPWRTAPCGKPYVLTIHEPEATP